MNCNLYRVTAHKTVSKIISGGEYMLQDVGGVLYVVYYSGQTESWLRTPLNNPETGRANFIPA